MGRARSRPRCGWRSAGGAAFLLVVLLGLLGLLVASPAAAQEKSWRIDRMDTVLDVQTNEDVIVDETVTFAFQGNFHYVTRSIPTGNLSGLTAIEVKQNGSPLPRGSGPGQWETTTSGARRIIKINFDLTNATATYTFHYVAKGAIMFFSQGDELRWYVFDAETPVPVEAVQTTVKLPGAVPETKLTAAVDTGPSVVAKTASPAPSRLLYTATAVPAYTRFWIVAGFPKGVVPYHLTPMRMAAFLVPKVGFLLPILTLLAMLLLWRRRGRDDPKGVFARYVTEPPSDLPPAIVGALIDEKVDVKEVIATIVDLARRGYIDMTESKDQGLFLSKTTTTFRRLKPNDDLTGVDLSVMKSLFDEHPEEVTTDELQNHFYKHVQGIVGDVYNDVTTMQLFAGNPATVRATWVGIGIAVGVILGGLSFLMAALGVAGYGFFLVGSVISALIIIGFSRSMPHRTTKGAQEQRKWEAFRNYLRDLTRFEDTASAQTIFDRYLPYAVAMGVERDWVRRFHDLSVPAPTWYHPVFIPGPWMGQGGMPGTQTTGLPVGMPGGGGVSMPSFNLDTISNSLFGSLNSISNVLTSQPSESGSGRGAWGGGGSFGGGFGGGGGGGGFGAG